MAEDREEKLKQYIVKYKSKVYALNNWIAIKNKDFNYKEALAAIYDFARGRETVMTKIIDQIRDFDKTRGRSQVYADEIKGKPDIIKNENGELTVVGINLDAEDTKVEPPAPTKEPRNPKIFRKDGQVKIPYKKTSDRFSDIGQVVRELYPDADKEFIELGIKGINDYAALRKKKITLILQRLKNGKLTLDRATGQVKPNVTESRTIVITEKMLNELKGDLAMTEHVFGSNVMQFLSDLLNDPINAQPSDVLRIHGLDRNKLLKHLNDYNVIVKREKISTKDGEGKPKTPTMKVKYGIVGTDCGQRNDADEFDVPKKKFKVKILKLYNDLFGNKAKPINEDGEGTISGGGDDPSGQVIQPLFTTIVKQKSNYIDEEEINETTTTTSVGGENGYAYDMPAFLDKETADRGGKNRSISMERLK